MDENKRGRAGGEEGGQLRGRETERLVPLPSLGSGEGQTLPPVKADLKRLIGRNRGRVR